MASFLLTAAAALGLVTANPVATAPTRSAQVLPVASAAAKIAPAKHIARTSTKLQQADGLAGAALLPFLLGLIAAGAGIAGLVASTGNSSHG